MSTLPVQTPYPALKAEVIRILQAGKERARQAIEREKVRTYWQVGRLLHEHLPAHKTGSVQLLPAGPGRPPLRCPLYQQTRQIQPLPGRTLLPSRRK